MAKKNKAPEKETVLEDLTAEGEVQAADNEVENADNGKEENGVEVEIEGGEEEELDELSLLQAELNKARQEAAEAKDKHVRLMAEFDNFRKRTRRETESFREYSSEEMMTALLPVIDDFGRTMAAMDNTDNLASLKEGVSLVNGKLWNILEKKGLKVLEPLGEPWSIDYHEVIHSLPVEEEEKKGKVLDVVEKGYQLKEKVIRYAKVVVGE